jgi:hypothetical protein
MPQAVRVELRRLVIDRHQPMAAGIRQCPRDRDRFRERLALRSHEGRELGSVEPARLKEDGAVEILVQGHAPLLPHFVDLGVTPVEVRRIEPKSVGRPGPLPGIPAPGSQDASDVEEDMADFHRSSGSSPATRTAGRPRPSSARKSPSACAASNSPKVNGSPGTRMSSVAGSRIWRKCPVGGPPLCS